MPAKTVLVMRATGAQGRGVIKHLIGSEWRVHALVSDTSSDHALVVQSLGEHVTLFQGTLTDRSSIETALEGCQALLLNQLPSSTENPVVQEARVLLDLAKAAGVAHVVFPSTLPLNNPNVREELKDSAAAPAVLSKGHVEDLVTASGLTWTLVRPGFFMTNLLPPLICWVYPEFKERKFVNSFGPECVLTLIDPDDIGAFIAAAFKEPARFGGRTVTVVVENMRVDDMLEGLEQASGRPIEAVYRSEEETEKAKSDSFVASNLMCIGLDNFAELYEVKGWGLQLTSFAQFLEKHRDELAL